jgi:glycosyltransferase involved in cell wall biosynthesis
MNNNLKVQKNRKKLIVIETKNFDTGGLEKVILDSAIELAKLGYEPHIVTPGIIGILAQMARAEGIPVHSVKKKLQLLFLLGRLKPFISISHFSYFGYKVYKYLGIPNVTFIHNIYAFLTKESFKEFQESDKYVRKYISVSNLASIYAVEVLGIDVRKIVTVPNGLNTLSEDEKSKNVNSFELSALGVDENDFIFLNVAAYNLHKGHYLMANALKQVLEFHPNVKLLCIGSQVYEPHFVELKKYVKEIGIESSMLFLGHHADITWFYQNSDAFVLPSFIEGWSIAMNEAMYYKLPMILTSVGGAPEVINQNDIGILIPNEYGDIRNLNSSLLDELAYSPRRYKIEKNLVSAMRDFVSNPLIWKHRGELGREKILKSHRLADVVKSYSEVIDEVANSEN